MYNLHKAFLILCVAHEMQLLYLQRKFPGTHSIGRRLQGLDTVAKKKLPASVRNQTLDIQLQLGTTD